jgi:hypothetical protein
LNASDRRACVVMVRSIEKPEKLWVLCGRNTTTMANAKEKRKLSFLFFFFFCWFCFCRHVFVRLFFYAILFFLHFIILKSFFFFKFQSSRRFWTAWGFCRHLVMAPRISRSRTCHGGSHVQWA